MPSTAMTTRCSSLLGERLGAEDEIRLVGQGHGGHGSVSFDGVDAAAGPAIRMPGAGDANGGCAAPRGGPAEPGPAARAAALLPRREAGDVGRVRYHLHLVAGQVREGEAQRHVGLAVERPVVDPRRQLDDGEARGIDRHPAVIV